MVRIGIVDLDLTSDFVALGTGSFLMALFSARHFGKFHGGNFPESKLAPPSEKE